MFSRCEQYFRICPYQANAYNNIYSIKYCTKQAYKIAAILCKNSILQFDAGRRIIIADLNRTYEQNTNKQEDSRKGKEENYEKTSQSEKHERNTCELLRR